MESREKIKQNMLGNTPKNAEVIGVYENLNEMKASSQRALDESEECEQSVTSRPTKQMDVRDEGEQDQSTPQWREYWASRQ